MRTIQDLQQLQGLPLNLKIRMTKERIRQWINEYGEDGVYVSFSGGKDSTVLLHLVREEYPNVKAVFVDTGLEFPEIRQFVKTFDNVEWLKPKMGFKQVIQKYGYPFISKEVSECVYGARKYLTSILQDASLDRPTDRPTDRPNRYAYERVTGTGAYARNGGGKYKHCPDRRIPQFSGAAGETSTSGISQENSNSDRDVHKGLSDKGEYP